MMPETATLQSISLPVGGASETVNEQGGRNSLSLFVFYTLVAAAPFPASEPSWQFFQHMQKNQFHHHCISTPEIAALVGDAPLC